MDGRMQIDNASKEDVAMLDLLIFKLEENMDSMGVKFFSYTKSKTKISNIMPSSSDEDYSYYDDDDDTMGDPTLSLLEPGLVTRVKLKFHSKADFSDRFSFDRPDIIDDGIYIGSFLNIEWDHITNMISIFIGHDMYDKKTKNNYLERVGGGDSFRCSFDFKLKYRHDIKLIKTRLGIMYAKIIVDKKAQEENHARAQLAKNATTAFPDLLDPVLLGGSLYEERNTRRILSKRRNGAKDRNSSSS